MNRSAVRYDPLMKDWLALYKYRGAEKLEPLFAAMGSYAYRQLREELALDSSSAQTVISYIPLSERRLGERGFNQAERTAAAISAEHGLPLLSLLVRTRHTEKQSYKTRRERLESLEGAFAVAPEGLMRLKDYLVQGPVNIILADDVYTTGSTLHRCAAELLSSYGAGQRVKVYGITWFR
ncbi:ComF family protein [Paenibacillus thermotolerans]|uniref:ComF family protein n=1 Tax=Paenibacillus thermotolerans TaxID=3027807 RepID=UPI0023687D33|nr:MULTISPECIES: hypothetical protein [unclassified Paenibacillus]